MPRTKRRLAAFILPVALLAAACGDESPDRTALINGLAGQTELTTEEATCVADEVFTSGLSEDDIASGSEDPTGDKGPVFQKAFDDALAACGIG